MSNVLTSLQNLSNVLSQYGTHMVLSLVVLIAGMLVIRGIYKGMLKLLPANKYSIIFCNAVYIILSIIVIMAAATEFGAKPANELRFLSIIILIVLGMIIFLKPFLPTMPFKVGNTIKAGDLLGVVEGITFLNTRLRTFDGKTFFVPNRKIISEIVINYHYTPNRRVKIDVGIQYDQDLVKAKQILEAVMVEDARVKNKPGPVVYVLNLAKDSVELGGRCWVENKEYWVARCDLIEKTKLRFDREGIKFAFPQLELHYNPGPAPDPYSGDNVMAGVKQNLPDHRI